ncbi:MAG: cell division protein FtsZ [Rubrivivax sp.]|nr:cell division protein FtsZ [Rubrivivax sp.]
MSLTLSLILLAAAVLAGLALHSGWKGRQQRMLRRPFAPTVAEEPRLEPSLGGETAGDPADDTPVLHDEALPLRAPRKPPVRLDALIDAMATVSPESPLSGELALAHMPASRRAGSKPMLIEGLDAETGEWEPLSHGRRYSEFQAGVQLANRSGALNEIEYSEFVQKVQAFADGVGAVADFPDMLDVVARARELDHFAGAADAQLSLRLRANGVAWSVGYVQQAAARQGFVPGALPGRLVLPGVLEGDPPMLVLGFDAQAALADAPQAGLREVTLSLDVAQTPEAAEPFPAWHRAATALCEEMDATAVDEQGVPVTLQAFDGISKELALLYRHLESRDLEAGSAAARRVFS